MHQAGEPPRKALSAPNAGQAAGGIVIDAGLRLFNAGLNQGIRQKLHIGGRQVQTLGAGGRHDVRGVACQKQSAKAHGFGHKTAQRGNAFLNARARDQCVTGFRIKAIFEFGPKGIVRPLLYFVSERHLQIVAAAGVTALRAQGKASMAVGVNELFVHGRCVGQHTQPAKGVNFFKLVDGIFGDAGAAHPMKTVAACNEVAL